MTFKPEPVPEELIRFIREGGKFLVIGHKEPDGDCIGSQLALVSALKRMGKQAVPYSEGPFNRPEIASYAQYFSPTITEADRSGGARGIILDCSSIDRIGDLENCLGDMPLAIIDHHASHESGRRSSSLFLDKNAPSTTFLILGLLEALGLSPTRDEADLLFLGLSTDTGFFRHVDDRGAEAFAYASRLIRAGANPKLAFQAMHGGKSLGSRLLMGAILARTEAYYGGKLLVSSEEYEETQKFGLEGRDSDALYQALQSVAGMEGIAIIRQESPEACSIGFRSRDWLNVAEIAGKFGGGGHKNASGALVSGTIREVKPLVVAAFKTQLEG